MPPSKFNPVFPLACVLLVLAGSHFLRSSNDVFTLAGVSLIILVYYGYSLRGGSSAQPPVFHLFYLAIILYGLTGLQHPVDSYQLLYEWQQFAIVPLFFISLYLSAGKIKLEKILSIYFIWLLILTVIANYQFFSGYDYSIYGSKGFTNRGKGFFDSWNILAGHLDLYIFIIFALWILDAKNNKNRLKWSIPAFGLIFTGLLSTYSRAGWLALLFGILVFSLLAPKPFLKARKKTLLLTGAGLVLLTVIYMSLPNAGGSLVERFEAIPLDPTELPEHLSGRPAVWQATLNMFKDSPWFGQGTGYFHFLSLKYFRPEATTAYYVSRTHSDYLQFLMELGIVGFTILLTFWIFYFRFLYKLYKLAKLKYDPFTQIKIAAVIAGITAVFFHTSVDFDFYIPATVLSIGFLTLYVLRLFKPAELPLMRSGQKWIRGAEIFIALLILALSVTRSVTKIEQNQGLAALNSEDLPAAIHHFELAGFFSPNYIPAFQMTGLSQAALGDIKRDTALLSLAESNLKQAVNLNKYNGISVKMMMQFYRLHPKLHSQPDRIAILTHYYQQLTAHIPNSGSTRRAAARDLYQAGGGAASLRILDDYLDRHPQDTRTAVLYVDLLMKTGGDSSKIAGRINHLKASDDPEALFIVGAYFQHFGVVDSAIAYYKQAGQIPFDDEPTQVNFSARVVSQLQQFEPGPERDGAIRQIESDYLNNTAFYISLSNNLHGQGLDRLARVAARTGLTLDPKNDSLLVFLNKLAVVENK